MSAPARSHVIDDNILCRQVADYQAICRGITVFNFRACCRLRLWLIPRADRYRADRFSTNEGVGNSKRPQTQTIAQADEGREGRNRPIQAPFGLGRQAPKTP